MAIREIAASGVRPNQGRQIINDNFTELDQRVGQAESGRVVNAGDVPSMQAVNQASLPAAGNTNRLIVVKEGGIYRDTGTALEFVAVRSWNNLTDKPSTFPPSPHSHAIGDLPVAPSGTSSTTQVPRADDARLSNATETQRGTAEIATQAETNAGTADNFIVSPLKLMNYRAIGAFSAYKDVAQNDIADITYTKSTLTAEKYDVSGWYDAPNSRYTPLIAGVYRFRLLAYITPAVDQKNFLVVLYKNGALYEWGSYSHASGTSGLVSGGVIDAVANGTTDYFEVFAWHSFGVSTSDMPASATNQVFSGHRIGAAT